MQTLKDVRSFYSDCWTMLLTYVTILIGFVGLVVPWLMKREFSSEMMMQRKRFQKYLRQSEANLKTLVNDHVGKEVSGLEKRVFEGFEDLDRKHGELERIAPLPGVSAMGDVIQRIGRSDRSERLADAGE